MALVFSLLAALAYGVSDFIGGRTTQRSSPWTVVCWSQAVATVAVLAAVPFMTGRLTAAALGWGAIAGLGSAAGSMALYQGLATARMNVVAPLSGVVAAALPVLVGLGTGERPGPLALLGVGVALAAIVLVSLTRRQPGADGPATSGLIAGPVAGAAFGMLFIGLQRPGPVAGIWPLAVAQVVALSAVLTAALLGGRPLRPPRGTATWSAVAGLLAATATLLYLQSTRHGLLSIVAVLGSLYPALTVILAAVVLHERSTRLQVVGMLGAAAAVALIAIG